MKVTLSVPSKTFLLGEYLALDGGPCLVANTGPRFQLEVNSRGDGNCQGIHPMSPAGRFMRQHKDLFQDIDLKFVDPHEGCGGLGASSAQFVTVFTWIFMNQVAFAKGFHQGFDARTLWQSYRDVSVEGKGKLPSGADVVAQAAGQLTSFSWRPFALETHPWVFDDLAFTLVRTGSKVATHDHLSKLQLGSFSDLNQPVQQALHALKEKRSAEFVAAVDRFHQWLLANQLVADRSRELLEEIQSAAPILAAKGCGAMGADILLLLHQPEEETSVSSALLQLGLERVATSTDVSRGLHVDWDFSMQSPALPASVIDFSERGPEL